MDLTIIQQGNFTSTGGNVIIPLRSDVDWMKVYNITQAAAAQTAAVAVEFYWQRGFATGGKWSYFKSNAASAANLSQYITTNGFTLLDTSMPLFGTLQNTISAISNAAIPVVTNGGTNGLVAGNVVRLYNVTGVQQFGGIDFTVGYNTLSGTTFSLDYAPQIVAGGAAGSFRTIKYNSIFYPRRRYIMSISQAAQAVVVTSVAHGYTVGQIVRFQTNSAFGMVEINGLQGTIVDIDTGTTVNSFTVNIDSTAFTAFAFPLTTQVPFTPAEVIPMGEDTSEALLADANILDDSTINTALLGMYLVGGTNCPAGANADVIYWVAGKSFSANSIQSFIAV